MLLAVATPMHMIAPVRDGTFSVVRVIDFKDGPRFDTKDAMLVTADWKVTPRLTLNLGLRYEFYTVPAEKYGLDTTLRNIFTCGMAGALHRWV